MRLNVHDYSGHPFQVQLSRALATRGHSVVHHYSTQYVTGRGRLTVGPADPATLRIEGVTCRQPLVKYSPLARARFEYAYARAWQERIENEDLDVVVACNVPLFALAKMSRYFARIGQPWVLWHQDLYSLGVGAELARILPPHLARPARARAEKLERLQVTDAHAVIAITDAMLDQYRAWGITRGDVHVLPNWAPVEDILPGPRDNAWSRAQELSGHRLRLMYAGTLGRKHNPMLLLEMLDALRSRGVDAELIVASEGVGAEDIKVRSRLRDDVRVVGYQAAEDLGAMLASADVMIALLEPDAARFSVPSKVLSYLCAGRPIVALVPSGNPAARDVEFAGGFVAPPTSHGAVAAAGWLEKVSKSPGALASIGVAARAMAEDRFDIIGIADRFEDVLARAAAGGAATDHGPSVLVGPLRDDKDAPEANATVA